MNTSRGLRQREFKILHWLRFEILGDRIWAFIYSDTRENERQVNGELSFYHSTVSLQLHLCKKYLTAVKIKTHFIFLLKKVLNISKYNGSLLFYEIQYVGEHVK